MLLIHIISQFDSFPVSTVIHIIMPRMQELRIAVAVEVYRANEADPTTVSHSLFKKISNGEGTLGELLWRALEENAEATKDLIVGEFKESTSSNWLLESAVNVTSMGQRVRRSTLYGKQLAGIVAGASIVACECASVLVSACQCV